MTEGASSDAGRALAALRKREHMTCPVCGAGFEAIKKAIYCSRACAKAGYRDRHRGELNARRRELYRRQQARE